MPNNLAALRTNHRFSQSKLADLVGVAPLTLGRWERGEALPRKCYLPALCQVLECTEEDLALYAPQTPPVLASPSDLAPLYDTAIPHTPIELIGRATELTHIKAQLLGQATGRMKLSALNGIPGVGKTSLAIAIAHDTEVRAFFSGGILWAALGPTPNIPILMTRWAELLGLSAAHFSKLGTDQKRQKLQGALGTRAMLLVLDDVWNMSDALALQIAGPNCASLLTTRFPRIASQMAVPEALPISELDTEQSIHVLRTLAPKVVESEPEKVHTLVQAVGGLPLALTLIGRYLRENSYHVPIRRTIEALAHLSNPQSRLLLSKLHVQAEAHPSIASSIPISLQSIIEVSDRFLTPTARETLYALSIFPPKPEHFSEEVALTVAASTTRELDELVDVGLLETNGKRYRLHRTIADYARLLVDDQTTQQLTQRLLAYMHQYIVSHAEQHELLEQEMALLLHSLDRVMTSAALQAQFVSLVCLSAPFLLTYGYDRETERFLERAYEIACTEHHTADIPRLLLYLADLDEKHGNLPRAQERYSHASQAIKQHAPSRRNIEVAILSYYGLARCHQHMGQLDQARTHGQQALALAQAKRLTLHEERIQAWYTTLLQPVTPTLSATCICGNIIISSPGPGRTRKYCSDRCANLARKRAQRQRQKHSGQP